MKPCLVIGSCIYPFSSFVKLNNPEEREELHLVALKRWIIESNFETIIICDNSNYIYSEELTRFALRYGKVLEILAFKGDRNKSRELGKGHGEGEIMEYILDNSKYINDFESFCKVTGKLFVENHKKYMDLKNIDFAFDFSFSFIWSKAKVDCIFTNFYFANLDSFKKFLKKEYLSVDDSNGFFLEHAYALALQSAKDITVIPILPIVSGVSGSSGFSYSYNRKLIACVKYLLLLTPLIRRP